jgi:hypothetical protein
MAAPDSSCVPNIGPRERRKRAMFGAAAFGLSLAVLTALALVA